MAVVIPRAPAGPASVVWRFHPGLIVVCGGDGGRRGFLCEVVEVEVLVAWKWLGARCVGGGGGGGGGRGVSTVREYYLTLLRFIPIRPS